MANTTWSSSDLLNITLSGTNNLVATRSGSTPGGVRTIDRVNTGKYYFEFTCTTWAGVQCHIGIGNGAAVLSTVAATNTGCCGILGNSGTVFLNGSSSGMPAFGARTNGDIVGVALDLDNKLLWFRIGPAGNWNNNAGFSPGGTGGISLAAICPSIPFSLYGLYAHNAGVASSITANFGDTAFSGAVPSGFTSGLTSGLVVTSVVATQVALEEWAQAATVPMWATQVALEEWATVQTTNPQMAVTQVALEEWASVALVSGASQARAMVMA